MTELLGFRFYELSVPEMNDRETLWKQFVALLK